MWNEFADKSGSNRATKYGISCHRIMWNEFWDKEILTALRNMAFLAAVALGGVYWWAMLMIDDLGAVK